MPLPRKHVFVTGNRVAGPLIFGTALLLACLPASSASASVNLTPFQPDDWSGKIVVSTVTGTNFDSGSLTATNTLYVDWAVINEGTTATGVLFRTELYVDGALRTWWYSDPPLQADYYSFVEDYSIGALTAGTHTIRIRTDSTGVISETNEADNEYTKTIVITGAQSCTAGPSQLCLNNNRFKVQVNWRVPSQNRTGTGTAIPLSGGDTGYFWFFDRANVELMVKVLDGRGVNGRFWVFYGALSDVEYTVTVTDTATGAVKSYFNPQGRVASVADTLAFTSSADPIAKVLGDHPQVETHAEEVPANARAGGEPVAASTGRSDGGAVPVRSGDVSANAIPCVPSTTVLCLNGNRFSVQVNWRVASQNASGVGTAVPLTPDTGYFWFFNSANVELVIKVLDGTPVNGMFWVFYGALSDVAYTITVKDTVTGAVRTYSNEQGSLSSRADTSAFSPDTGAAAQSAAVSADAAGRATFNIGDVRVPIQLIDEATRAPISGLSVAFALDPVSRSHGVLMVIDPLQRYPPQIVILRGASPGQSTIRTGSSLSQTADDDPAVVPVSTALTRTIETVATTTLTAALRYVPGAGDIKDLAVVGAKAFNRLGVPTGPLTGLDYVRTELLTQEEALAGIKKDVQDDVRQELQFLTGELLLTGGIIAPVTVAAVTILAVQVVDSANTVLNCGLPTQQVRITRVGPDPLGMKFYECQDMYTSMPLYRVPAQGTDERGLPLTTGSLDLISKSHIGLGIRTILDSQGKATPEVPVGDYEVRLTSPGFSPAARAVKVPRGGTSLSIKLDRLRASGCTYSLSPTSQSLGSSSGSGSVAVTVSSGCGWVATSSASWITITSGASGTGNSTVRYSVGANTGTSQRTGTMTIAGLAFTVTQAGASSGLTRMIGLSGNLAFGSVTVGQVKNAILTITNSGNSTLTVTGLTAPPGGAYTASWTNGAIPPGAAQLVTVFFTPPAAQSYNGNLTVIGDQTSGINTIAISGTGVGAAPPPGTTKYDGTYDFFFKYPGPGGTVPVNSPRYFFIRNGAISSSDGAISGAVVDSFGRVRFTGPCPTNSSVATWIGNMNASALAGANFGEGTYTCGLAIPGGSLNSWQVTQSR